MSDKNPSLKRKLVQAGGWNVAKRVAKSVPYVGSVLAIGLIGYDIKRKGVVNGVLNTGIDAIPFVGMGKNVIEFFTGDFFPDKKTDGKTVKNKNPKL
ncbi:MAG: hypothetical protein H0W58_01055 [Acidobacteria bacterium]|jgi:hypothetical protein|nr:hypothetical protein [Acidobacteriota bacterium]